MDLAAEYHRLYVEDEQLQAARSANAEQRAYIVRQLRRQHTQSEVARLLGITQGRVSQIERQAGKYPVRDQPAND
jgi:DNA-directed RNA polymerase specialized sigma subunit